MPTVISNEKCISLFTNGTSDCLMRTDDCTVRSLNVYGTICSNKYTHFLIIPKSPIFERAPIEYVDLHYHQMLFVSVCMSIECVMLIVCTEMTQETDDGLSLS